jgi:hypothetical protein
MQTIKQTKKEIMFQNISAHGANLNKIFNTSFDNVTLCKKLRRLELKASYATTCLCNTNTLNLLELNRFTGYDVEQTTEEAQDLFFDKIYKSIYKILGEKAKQYIFINFDPRGYALKIKSEYVKKEFTAGNNIYTDFGSYGILAPDFNN